MLGIRLQGRLGNQLFQYAFILSAAKKLNSSFYIDQYIESDIISTYFKIPANKCPAISQLFKINGFKNLFSFHLRRFYYKYKFQISRLTIAEHSFNEHCSAIAITNNTLYLGFFQSELFFKDIAGLIRDKFSLKKVFIDQFKNEYGKLYQDNYIVTIHIRRSDYQNQLHLNLGGANLTLPLSYYNKVISKFATQKVHFVFVSDDLDFVNQHFSHIVNKTVSTGDLIFDFQHLLNADACITSNSTFSWWGAWLNNKPEKIIYAPKHFLGWRIKKQVPIEIYPDNWILIDFDNG